MNSHMKEFIVILRQKDTFTVKNVQFDSNPIRFVQVQAEIPS